MYVLFVCALCVVALTPLCFGCACLFVVALVCVCLVWCVVFLVICFNVYCLFSVLVPDDVLIGVLFCVGSVWCCCKRCLFHFVRLLFVFANVCVS